MSDSTSLVQLPPEVILGIFYHLDIPDIFRTRRVSRYLNEIGRSRDVWTNAYRTAEFVRPPGPFLSQSTVDLEKALVSSFLLHRNLRHGSGPSTTERPARKLREIRFTGVPIRVRLVFQRFLILAFQDEVRCYNLDLDAWDSNSGASIIYRPTGGKLLSFHCASAFDLEGNSFACAVLVESVNATKRISAYLLSVREASDVTLDLLHQFERDDYHSIDTVDLGPRILVIQGRVGHDPSATWHVAAIDVHTRMVFLFPNLTPAAWAHEAMVSGFSIDGASIFLESMSTSTHLLLAWSFHSPAVGGNTFFQAFALPPLDDHHHSTPPPTSLSLSHSSVIPSVQVSSTIFLNDSIIDPTTQDVLISVRVHTHSPAFPTGSPARHGVLRLSTAHTSVTLQVHGFLGPLSEAPLVYRSGDGMGRVFYTPLAAGVSHLALSALEYDVRASMKSDSEQEIRIVEYPSILRFPSLRILTDYDPYSGRVCLEFAIKYGVAMVVEIWDFAV